MSRKSERELVVRQFIQREEEIYHPGYDTELDFYEGVSVTEELQMRIWNLMTATARSTVRCAGFFPPTKSVICVIT